jgi:hypothetical protein
MKKLRVIAILVILTLSSTANATFRDGNRLVEAMNAYNNPQSEFSFRAGDFMGYVGGVADVTGGVLWCAPSNVQFGQLPSIVSKYLNNHPEIWHKPAHVLVINALRDAFPCK